jgi:hypothetical protein
MSEVTRERRAGGQVEDRRREEGGIVLFFGREGRLGLSRVRRGRGRGR